MTTVCTHVEVGSERAGKPVAFASVGVERIGRGLSRGTGVVRVRAYWLAQGEETMKVTCGAKQWFVRPYPRDFLMD